MPTGGKRPNRAKTFQTGPKSEPDQHLHCEHPAAALEQNEVVRGLARGVGHLTPLCTKALLSLALKATFHDICHRQCLHILLFPLAPVVPSLPLGPARKHSPHKRSCSQILHIALPDRWYQV